ncbi:tRNA nucleotidyltransferase (CCA-adding enzyme) [Gracilibacillus ureilyticus]|uniref:CCA-adding enzyme n=1 Tax=Gracilibacillus ureilyticus TaxID=531814 RepID=A0A1H9LNF4_9BACI|nr:CCA tRNA nucleotidyltransferase [Gracilibacillus ureilyticus]SER12737.1 tRNA nucleotidyltransferase (CCA-adding enzyme) [Gracilibacillus ureilyticus]
MNESAFQKARPLIQVFIKQQYEAYIIGGAVRDHLLGRHISDIDIATSARPEEVMNLFEKVIPTGIKHGTVLVQYEDESYEVTTFRQESDYEDYRHPNQVQYVMDIKEDLARRDFTFNAIAMDVNFSIIDPFDGTTDIQKQIIRTVGNANERFSEDPLRMMRAIRFNSQLGFSIEKKTMEAIKRNASLLSHISMERIADEWKKLLSGKFFSKCIDILFYTGLYNYLPVIAENRTIQEKIKQLKEPLPTFSVMIAYLTISQPEVSVSEWTNSWKLSNMTKRESIQLMEAINTWKNGEKNWAIYNLPKDLLNQFVLLYNLLYKSAVSEKEIYEMKAALPISNRSQLAFKGNHVLEIFPERTPGNWIKDLLTEVEKSVINGQLKNDRKMISEWVMDERDKEGPTN